MTQKDMLKLIRKHKPRKLDQFQTLFGARLDCSLGQDGAFREIATLSTDEGLLVVKIPRGGLSDIRHSKLEVTKIRRLQRLRILRPYLPKILYYDSPSGVIIMPFYDNCYSPEIRGDHLGKLVGQLLMKYVGVSVRDICTGNCRLGEDNQLVIIDFGY